MKKLTLFVAALCATTMAFAATDYSAVYTSNVTMTAGTNGSTASVTIGETKYNAMKLGTGKKTGTMTIAVPKEKNVIYLHAAAWNGASCSLKLSTGNAGVTLSIDSLALKNNAGIQGSSPFTFDGDVTSDYFFTVKIEGNTAGFTLTISSCENGLYRGVIWGVNADALEAVNATAVALDKNAVELEQYKYITLTATPTPADATDEWEWKSDNEEVATVNAKGKVTVLAGNGTATITVTSKTTATVTATCVVTAKAADVLTCAQAVEIAKTVSANNEVAAGGKYVIRGYVTKIVETFGSYGNMSVMMADVAGDEGTFEAFRVIPIAEADQKIKVGDLVEVVGDITKYNTTYETVTGGSIRLITAGPATALENVEALEVYAENGRIYAAEGARIFTVSGIDVTEMNGQLNGIYIVKVGNQATKIAVK